MAISAPLIIAGVGALTGAGGLAASAVQSNQTRIAGERQASAQQNQQEQLIKQQQDQQTQTQQQQAMIAQSARQRTLGSLTKTSDMGGTILTSPLGLPGGGGTANAGGAKTLLGA